MKITDKISNNHLIEFANHCKELFDVNELEIIDEAKKSIKYYNGDLSMRESLRHLQRIENEWYESLKTSPNYSLYDDLMLLPDLWACWKIYSRNYILAMANPKTLAKRDSENNFIELKSIVDDVGDIKKVIDVGCGIGYTTLALQELFPNAKVYGTNFINGFQYKLCTKIGVDVKGDVSEVGECDLVFASEYFEHFENPIEHLNHIVNTCNPKYLIIANSFGTTSMGHFFEHTYNLDKLPSKGFGRIFNNELRNLGYKKVNTNCFNNRPTYWKKAKKLTQPNLF